MSINYDIADRGGRKTWSWPLLAAAGINAMFAAMILSAWTFMSMFIAEPLAWATWMRVHRSSSFFDIFNYPFVLLWLLPVCGLATAYVAGEGRKWSMAWCALTLPIVVHGTTIGWYYLAPQAWH